MELWLHRDTFTAEVTLGRLYINGVYECEVLEDRFRGDEPKVPGRTAIPMGTYPVKLTMSPRFRRVLPLVDNVPGFTGVRIHAGNTADDTEGCLLPGKRRGELNGRYAVLDSAQAHRELLGKLVCAKAITLTISFDPPPNLRGHPEGAAP